MSYLVAFEAINNFVKDLWSVLGTKNKPLSLYYRLISKTTFSHLVSIEKHINLFRQFVTVNKDAITNKNKNQLVENLVVFTEGRIFIDFNFIFSHSDKDMENAIWKHLLVITGILEPENLDRVKNVLSKSEKPEAKIVSSMLDKIEANIDPNSNPMESVMKLMGTDVFSDIMSQMQEGLSSGSLNINELISTVSSMASDTKSDGNVDFSTMMENTLNKN